MHGTLYLVSVGAGHPDWMTLHALQTIEHCPVIAAPRVGEAMTALRIAEGAANLSGKEILPLDLPMSREMKSHYDHAAKSICRCLENGKDTAFLCLGDASVYASATPIGSRVQKCGFRVETVAGVTSFCAAAAAAGVPIATGDAPVQILPFGCEDFAERLRLSGTKVILKAGHHMETLCDLLEACGLLADAVAVEHCGMPDERICRDLRNGGDFGYFTVVIVPA